MTDTLHAIFNRTWLLHCDFCDDRVRLVCPDVTVDRELWQRFVNHWKDEHGGHVYMDSVPSTLPGPVTAYPDELAVRRCVESEAS